MLQVMVSVRETIGGPNVVARVYEEHGDGCRSLLMEQDYYPDVPPEVLDDDPLLVACVALRQWAVRTIGSPPYGLDRPGN